MPEILYALLRTSHIKIKINHINTGRCIECIKV